MGSCKVILFRWTTQLPSQLSSTIVHFSSSHFRRRPLCGHGSPRSPHDIRGFLLFSECRKRKRTQLVELQTSIATYIPILGNRTRVRTVNLWSSLKLEQKCCHLGLKTAGFQMFLGFLKLQGLPSGICWGAPSTFFTVGRGSLSKYLRGASL